MVGFIETTISILLNETTISVLLIFIFILLIDLIDIRVLTNSFSFLKLFSYHSYFILRVVLGFVAWSILITTNLEYLNDVQKIILLSLFSVLFSITAVQNFSFSIGFKNIIDLSSMFNQFKDVIVNECSDKEVEKNKIISEEKTSIIINLINDLAEKIPLDTLRSECIFVLHSSNSLIDAKKQVEECESEINSKDSDLLKKLFASKIVYTNLKYGELLLKRF